MTTHRFKKSKPVILITGGAGFIGSHVVRLFVKSKNYTVINVDNLTYAGNLTNLKDIENESNYCFKKGNICDYEFLERLFNNYDIDGIIHLAAETHVDRSISDPTIFIKTNILGTVNLMKASINHWKETKNKLFYHISTDEVYGSLKKSGLFTESSSYDPQSPYSASKASSDHFVRAYGNTYQVPIIISNCSNNYGPNQFPEKLIPLMINNVKNTQPLPVYGKGENIRDWLYVKDHAHAIQTIFEKGKIGETYNVGGLNEWKNIDLVLLLCDLMDQKMNKKSGTSKKLITFVKDRAGHDLRYAIDVTKITTELHWKPTLSFKEGLSKTIDWYLNNDKWLKQVTSGDYQNYYKLNYKDR